MKFDESTYIKHCIILKLIFQIFVLTFVCHYVITTFIEMRISRCGLPLLFRNYVTSEEVVHMIEAALLEIIYLLLFGIISETICVFALIILVIIKSK